MESQSGTPRQNPISQGLLMKLVFLGSKSRVPRHTLISLCPLVKLGLLGPKRNDRNSAAATAAVKSFAEARPLGIARRSATAERELAESSDEVGPSWSKAKWHEQCPPRHQLSSLLVKLGLLESQSRVPRRNVNSQRVPVGLGWAFLVQGKWPEKRRRCSRRNACW